MPCPHSLGPHLDLQLLHHLHLHAALGRAPVVQGVLRVEVSSGGRRGRTRQSWPWLSCCHHPPLLSSNPAHGLESRQTMTYKEGNQTKKRAKKKTGPRRKPPSRQPPLMSLLKSQLQRDLIANELIK